MTKIKNFRLTLRPREVTRLLKHAQEVQMTPELEASIEHAVNDAKRWLEPAAIYTTLTRATAEKTTPITLPDGAVAISIVAATIGPKLDQERLQAESADAMRSALLAAIQQEAVGQAVQFALRLIQEQAKEEECEMSAPLTIQEAALLPPLAGLLGLQRIGLHLEEAAPQSPPYTRLIWTHWMPLRKSGARRSETSSRTAKASV